MLFHRAFRGKHIFPLALLLLGAYGLTCTLAQLPLPSGGRPAFASSNAAPAGTSNSYNEIVLASFRNVTPGAQQFGLDLFRLISETVQSSGVRKDFMISPFSVWSLLLLLVEGAQGETLQQLRSVLHIEEELRTLRQAYSLVQKYLQTKTTTIEVGSLQAIFTNVNEPPQREYEDIIMRYYGASLIPMDFHNPNETYVRINEVVRSATRGLIQHALNPQDLIDARVVLLSSLYFKGQWKHPFNRSLTVTEPFYDEEGNDIGTVEMMMQEANFKYVGINELEGHVLELPYGKEDRLSMLIILPKRGVTLNQVARNLQKFGTASIFQRLSDAAVGYEDDEVEVHLPRFDTWTDISLGATLYQLGITDIFHAQIANLSLISPNLFVKDIYHSTKIIVDEEGTEAAAVTSAVLANKATPPKFHLNRPFIYLIVEKSTNVLLFAGQVINPNQQKPSTQRG